MTYKMWKVYGERTVSRKQIVVSVKFFQNSELSGLVTNSESDHNGKSDWNVLKWSSVHCLEDRRNEHE